MEVEDIDVVSAELAKRVLDGVVKRLHVVTAVLGFLLEVLDELIVGGVLHNTQCMLMSNSTTFDQKVRTLVATTSWSRLPRRSIHSPMNSSEVSSW